MEWDPDLRSETSSITSRESSKDGVLLSLASLKDYPRNRKPSLSNPNLIAQEFKKRHSVQSTAQIHTQLSAFQHKNFEPDLPQIPESPQSLQDIGSPARLPTLPSLTSQPSKFLSLTSSNRSVQSTGLSYVRPGEPSYHGSYLPRNYDIGVQIVNDHEANSSSPFRLRIEISVLDQTRKLANCSWKLLVERTFKLRPTTPICLNLQHSLREHPEIDQNKHEMAFKITIEKLKSKEKFARKLQEIVPLSHLLSETCNSISHVFLQKRFGASKTIRLDVQLRFAPEKLPG
jgi:hypothetical protein